MLLAALAIGLIVALGTGSLTWRRFVNHLLEQMSADARGHPSGEFRMRPAGGWHGLSATQYFSVAPTRGRRDRAGDLPRDRSPAWRSYLAESANGGGSLFQFTLPLG